MKQLVIIKLLVIAIVNYSFGCGCDGPINEIKIDIGSSDAIFIGEIKEINKKHTFHLSGGNGLGLKYINFDVLKTYRGLNQAQLKITLFDSDSNSSCEGIFWGKEVGDTVLVFANKMSKRMIASYLCGRHPIFKELSIEERNFIDTANWIDPRSEHLNAEKTYQNFFGRETINTSKKNEKNWKEQIEIPFYLSVGLNLILLVYILRLRSKYRR